MTSTRKYLTKPTSDWAKRIFDACKEEKPSFGLEQEYSIMNISQGTPWPLGFPSSGYPAPQGPYYCSVGGLNNFGRAYSEHLMSLCLDMGLEVGGTNAEVMCGQ